MNITIFEKYWGNLTATLFSTELNLLPRLSLISMTQAYLIVVGILNIHIQLTLWTKGMREYLKNSKR